MKLVPEVLASTAHAVQKIAVGLVGRLRESH